MRAIFLIQWFWSEFQLATMQCCYFRKHYFFSTASAFASVDYNTVDYIIQHHCGQINLAACVRTNHRPGPVNTNWGDQVGICKLRPGWASKYKFGVNTNWGSEPVNTNWRPGPVNTNLGPGLINTNLVPRPVNTNLGPGPGAKHRAGGQEIQIPVLIYKWGHLYIILLADNILTINI